MKVETTTVMFLTVINLLAMLLIMVHTRLTRKTYPGFDIWTAGIAAWLAGSVVSWVLRGVVDDFWSIVVGNCLLLMLPILFLEGANRFHGIPGRWWRTPLNLVLLAVATALIYRYRFVTDRIATRVVIVSLFQALLFTRTAVEPLLDRMGRRYSMQWLLSVCLVPHVIVQSLRALFFLDQPGLATFAHFAATDNLLLATVLLGHFNAIVMTYSYLSLTSDRTEMGLRQMQERQKGLADAQRQFFAMASHEFKTPLAVIDRSAQMLAFHNGDRDARITERTTTIRDQSRHLLELLETCLNDSVLARGELELKPEPIDLRALLERVVTGLETVNPERTIRVQGGRQAVTLQGDGKLLFHLVNNVVDNALKFSQGEAPVTLKLSAGNDLALIAVCDHGVGIPAAELEQVGTRAFRASTARRTHGNGIGLHTARMIAALHGGRLEIDSKEGCWTVVTISLPVG